MGFGDKLKGLKDQAQQAVADTKDKIQHAVLVVGDAANTKTHGKYAAKIMKVGEKVESSVDKFAASPEAGGEGAPNAASETPTEAPAAAPAEAPAAAPAEAPAAAPAEAPADAPDPAFNIEDGAPQEDSESAPVAHEPHNPVTPSAADEAASGFPEFE